ncbi:MAG: response regulator transcription factor [Lachnospiraceae bacterium]|nr:response regulator transcription factor [Lachnospiraceae bacterium]
MIRILIVEDERPISDLIRMSLEDAGYICTCAYDGMTAANLLEANDYDLVLLDIMLPEIDGYELFEYIKPLDMPVIFITAKAELADRVKGLNLGAEDYIVKPFEIVELLARVHVVLRRYRKTETHLMFRDIVIDTENRHVTKNGQDLVLTPKEYELLVLFLRNQEMTLFRERIYESVWNAEYSGDTRTLDLHVQRLRKKTGLDKELKTVYGVGYRLESGKIE